MSITENKNKLKIKTTYIENVLTDRKEWSMAALVASSNTRKRIGEIMKIGYKNRNKFKMGVVGQHHEKKLKKLRKSSWTKASTLNNTRLHPRHHIIRTITWKKNKKETIKICITIAMSWHCCVGREKWNSFTLRIYVCIRESKIH